MYGWTSYHIYMYIFIALLRRLIILNNVICRLVINRCHRKRVEAHYTSWYNYKKCSKLREKQHIQNKRPMRAYALLVWFFAHFQSRACMYGEDRIVNGGSFVFKRCIIAIFTISWAIIQSCRIWLVFKRNQALINI